MTRQEAVNKIISLEVHGFSCALIRVIDFAESRGYIEYETPGSAVNYAISR